MPDILQTTTPVHSEESMRREKSLTRLKEQTSMIGVSLFAQLLSFGAMYLQPAAASSAWWAACLLMIPALLLYALSRAGVRKLPADAARSPVFCLVYGVCALLFTTDMAMSLLSIVELTDAYVLPGASRALVTLFTLLAVLLSSSAAAPRMARFLRVFLIGAFLFGALTVLPSGHSGYLFPRAGYGAYHTLRCAALSCGSVWSVLALPLITLGEDSAIIRRAHNCRSVCATILLLGLLFLCCTFVMPASGLSGSRGYAMRLQLLMEVSANTLAWSLLLTAELFLFLTALSCAGTLARNCLKTALKCKNVPLFPFLLLSAPLALSGTGVSEPLLIALLPLRYPLSLLLTVMCLLYRPKRKANA